MQKRQINTVSTRYHVFPSSTYNLFPYPPMFVNYFHAVQNQYMVFWLWKDAQLACNRCPFGCLLTPFWTRSKHLLKCTRTSVWCSASYKDTILSAFRDFQWDIFVSFVMIFQSEGKVIFRVRGRLFSGEGVRFKSIKKACHDHATDSQTNTLCF